MNFICSLDTEGKLFEKYDLSCLKTVMVPGDKPNYNSLKWLKKQLHDHTTVTDTYGMTELGENAFHNIVNTRDFGQALDL